MIRYTTMLAREQAALDTEPFHRFEFPDGTVWTEFYRAGLDYLLRFPGLADFEVSGDEVIVRDGDKRYVISLTYEGDRRLGSLDLPMTRVEYTCSGCTEDEAKAFHDHMAKHLMRAGGG